MINTLKSKNDSTNNKVYLWALAAIFLAAFIPQVYATTYISMQTIPSVCTGGNITSDAINGGGGRVISCSATSANLSIIVYNKPGDASPQYFEMYKQSSAGSGVQICLLTTCISNSGYAKSPLFPISDGPVVNGSINITTTPGGASISLNGNPAGLSSSGASGTLFIPNALPGSNTILASLTGYLNFQSIISVVSNQTLNVNAILQLNNTNTTNSSNTTQNTTQYFHVKDIPATCNGGTIVKDTFVSGRDIICASSTSSLEIGAWDKPNIQSATYFEMDKLAQNGTGLQLCLLTTCISNNGFAQSPNFPITGPASTNTTNTTNTTSNLGNINLTTIPTGANVTLNNNFLGTTDINGNMFIQNITAGVNTLTVSATGYLTNISTVNVIANQIVNDAITLQPINNTNSTNTTNTTTNFGSINLITSPTGANVALNGLPLGVTDINGNMLIQNITPGTQNLSVTSPGFLDFVSAINVSANQTTNVTVVLQALQKSLSLMITPGFPDGLSYGFICLPINFTPSGYDWKFGDGANFSNVTNTVYHAYASSGGYIVQCTATGTNITVSMNITANVSTTFPGTYITDPNNQPPLPPTWLEPGATDVYPNDFHLHTNNAVFQGPDAANDSVIYSDYEIWNVALNQLVWASYKESVDPYHIHIMDGNFMGNFSANKTLDFNTTYEVRARFYENAQFNNVSNWSNWRVFQTLPPINITPTATSWTPAPGYQITKVASNISLPVNVIMAPSLYNNLPIGKQPLLYVTQLYGQVGVLLQDGTYKQYAGNLLGAPSPGGIPGGGEAGVDGLYVDSISGDVYISMSYVDNTSSTGMSAKVIHFVTNATGDGFTSSSTIIDKIPVRPSHEAHTILKGPDGKMYLSVGDADQLTWPQDPTKFGGKVLRLNWDGSMPSDNPFPGTYSYAIGFRNPFGMAFRPGTNELYVSNNGQDTDDGFYKTFPGSVFGWPTNLTLGAWVNWHVEIAPTQVAFDQVDAFPNDTQNVYVVGSGSTYLQGPSPNSKRIFQIPIKSDGTPGSLPPNQNALVTYTGSGFGDPIGVTFAPDGAYFTDIYGDAGFTGAGVTQGNIYKVVWTGQNSTVNQTNVTTNTTFSAVIAQHPWYPQGLNMIWDCKTTGGSGNFTYDYVFGDGSQQLHYNQNNVWHTYASHGTYTASCTVHDLNNSQTAGGSTNLTI